MKSILKTTFERVAPSIFYWAQARRQRAYFRRSFEGFQNDARSRLFPNGAPIYVLTGPFKGMQYFNEVVWGSITPKWLGSYEAELEEPLLRLLKAPVTTIIDVGCAEGYYAVGSAITNPQAKVFAFDIDPFSRRQTAALASLNAVQDRVVIGRFCSHDDVERIAEADKTLIICDIEGSEIDLLDPNKAPSLRHANVLVELHEVDQNSRIVEQCLLERFRTTHEIETIRARPRNDWIRINSGSIPKVEDRDFILAATNEHRTNGQAWLAMIPKT